MLTTKMVAAARNRIWVASIRANMGTSPVPHPDNTSDCNNGRTVSPNRIIVPKRAASDLNYRFAQKSDE